MSEEKLLFVEKQLNRWKRPESPKPGTAFVFVGDGKPSIVVYEGQQGPTLGELIWGKYTVYYEVDMGERSLDFHEKIPCADAFEFNAEVRLTYAVNDNPVVQAPALIVRSARTDASQFLKNLAIDVMRRTSRRYPHEESGKAENSIAAQIEEEVRDKGFKLSRSAFVKLSLDEAVRSRLVNRQLGNYDFQDQETKIARDFKLEEFQQNAKFNLKEKKAHFFAPLIKEGDWETLLAMLDPNDPEDAAIKGMIEATWNQEKMLAEKQQKLFELALEKGAIEDYELGNAARKALEGFTEVPRKSVASLQSGSTIEDAESVSIDKQADKPEELGRDENENE